MAEEKHTYQSIESILVAPTKPWDEYTAVKNDPLTQEQHIKIIEFAYRVRYALIVRDIDRAARNLVDKKRKPLATKDTVQFDDVSEKNFQTFVEVLNNPTIRAEEFGIDPNNSRQVYATRILLRSVFEANLSVKKETEANKGKIDPYNQTSDPYLESIEKYRENLCTHGKSGRFETTITSIHQLLMQDDSVKRIDPNNKKLSSLDIILANTHFQSGTFAVETSSDLQTGMVTKSYYSINREKYRKRLKKELTKLYFDPKTHHVMVALGEVVRESQGNLLFSGTTMSTGSLGTSYVPREIVGFYNYDNAIICSALIHPIIGDVHGQDTLIHEALHFVFAVVVGNKFSPEDEAALDAAIKDDQKHREKLDRKSLNSHERSVWTTVVNNLEQESFYFSDPFGLGRNKQEKMRQEVIVKPMEQIAAGVSEEAVKKVMPNVYAFYQQKCKPLIEKYVRERYEILGIEPVQINHQADEKVDHAPLYTVKTEQFVTRKRQHLYPALPVDSDSDDEESLPSSLSSSSGSSSTVTGYGSFNYQRMNDGPSTDKDKVPGVVYESRCCGCWFTPVPRK